ncbi:hypothetical protein [Tellurirhabdus bombi]|uniref:hypothetical protein n=1 Tax=Tellurirhabdus bombi TaxID=2907205 RepID=UPI001F475D2A|nr:hypothetical protein [Tellurirhabdus bombi]
MNTLESTRGKITVQFGGRQRTFKFGLRSNIILSELIDFKKLSEGDIETSANSLAATFLSGLIAAGEAENEVTKKTPFEQVEDWIFEMGEESAADVYELAQHAMGFTSRLTEIVKDRHARKSGGKS